MAEVQIQGVDARFDDYYDQDGNKRNLALAKDSRPFKVKYAFFFSTMLPLLISATCIFFSFFLKNFWLPLWVISFVSIFVWRGMRQRYMKKQKGLFDKPKYLDYNKKAAEVDAFPKDLEKEVKAAAPGVGEGVYFFGHELFTEQEIHAADSKVRTHIIIFGTTGSGKTENILSICVNFLTQASGFILVDGKGDTLLFAKTFSLCRAYGRTDDLYLLNFMDPGKGATEKRVERITHKFNFFVDSTAAEANEIVAGLMPSDGGSGSGMWEGRASAGMEAINKALYWLKDHGYLDIDPDTYRNYFALDEFVALAMNDDIPKPYRAALHSILTSINYKVPTDQDKNPKQNPATEEQFQYITMQFTSTFGMLAEQYGHITVSQVPDISITDIVLRRRILLVLLPSLSKAEQSVRNLGRIMIAMTRNVSAKAIGGQVEGNIETTIESKPTAAISSYGLIFDEFGAYATKGASTLPAQVRSLNMVCIFAGQDYEAFKKGDEIEAATIFANCTIKICMKLEDPLTFEKFKESSGQRYVMVQESFENKDTMFGRKTVPSESARVEKRDVLDLVDLKAQGPGQETLIYGDTTYRLLAFYADPKLTKKARLNHFLEIKRPKHPTVTAMRVGVDQLYRKLKERIDKDWESQELAAERSINAFSSFKTHMSEIFTKVEAGIKSASECADPTPTEISSFVIAAYLKKVELVDHNVKKSVSQLMGFEYEDDYDDSELLSDGSADLDGFLVSSSSGMQTLDPVIEPEKVPVSIDTSDEKPVDNEKAAAPENVQPATSEPDVVEKGVGLDDELLRKIERSLDSKQGKLNRAIEKSFNSLEAINMSVFDTQRHIQKLEEVLLQKSGRSKKEAERLSELTSANLMVDMGMRTNPAIISESERKQKSPSRSSQEVRNMIEKFTKG